MPFHREPGLRITDPCPRDVPEPPSIANDRHQWNNAGHAALFVSSPKVAVLLQDLDGQVDSLTTRAVTKQSTLVEFRRNATVLVS